MWMLTTGPVCQLHVRRHPSREVRDCAPVPSAERIHSDRVAHHSVSYITSFIICSLIMPLCSAVSATMSRGLCSSGCDKFGPFLVALFFLMFFQFAAVSPAVTVSLR